jgi:hypothetical protein
MMRMLAGAAVVAALAGAGCGGTHPATSVPAKVTSAEQIIRRWLERCPKGGINDPQTHTMRCADATIRKGTAPKCPAGWTATKAGARLVCSSDVEFDTQP